MQPNPNKLTTKVLAQQATQSQAYIPEKITNNEYVLYAIGY